MSTDSPEKQPKKEKEKPKPEVMDLGEVEAPEDVTVVAPFRVSHDKESFPFHEYFEIVTTPNDSPESVLYKFVSVRSKQEVGIELKPDGSIVVGGWDEEGEWVELGLTDDPDASDFDTAAFANALEGNITPS